jgi:hypothetical protein
MSAMLVLFVLVLLAVTQAAIAAPCECKDIKAFKSRIAEVNHYLEAFRSVMSDCYSENPPTDFTQLGQRFDQYAFGGQRPSNIQTAGTVSPIGGQSTPAFEKMYCDTIVRAVKDVHEGDHNKFMWIHALPLLVGVAFGNPYTAMIRNTVLTEIEAHEAEKEYLEQELQKLEARCKQTWKCRCNQQMYPSAGACAASCPHASLSCVAPTCLEIDPKTGKWTGKGY